VDLAWLAGACVLAVASFVFGLTGFGIGLVALSLLPFLLPPATIVPLITIYCGAFALVMTVQLRREVLLLPLGALLLGSLLGTPAGVWLLTTCSPSVLRRLIGAILVAVVLIEWCGRYPEKLSGYAWALGTGGCAGLLGGAMATPGPPVILYALGQGWSPRVMKAMLQAFFLVNQAFILVSLWWAGLLTREVTWLAISYALPAGLGVFAGMLVFEYIDQRRFRRLMFSLLFVLGLVLGVRG